MFSADGKTLYYRAMTRPGFEADRFALMAMDLATGKTREIAPKWDALRRRHHPVRRRQIDLHHGAANSAGIRCSRCRWPTAKSRRCWSRTARVSSFDLAGDTLAISAQFDEERRRDLRHQRRRQGAAARDHPQRRRDAAGRAPSATYEQFNFKGWNNETVHGYVVKPWNYEEGKKYPVAFLIHGGPQGSFGDGWSYRWNPQTYAGQGYAVVMIDFHGSTGYGQKFTDAISQHWGDRPLEDLQKGWAAAQEKYAFLDGDTRLRARRAATAASWSTGSPATGTRQAVEVPGHPRRRVRPARMMGYATEELWFTEWEQGGTPYDGAEELRAVQPGQPRQGLEDADAGDPRPARLPHPGGAGHRRVHRAAAPRHRIASSCTSRTRTTGC